MWATVAKSMTAASGSESRRTAPSPTSSSDCCSALSWNVVQLAGCVTAMAVGASPNWDVTVSTIHLA